MISGPAMNAVTKTNNLPAKTSLPDKIWVGRSFSRAAQTYDRVAALQRQVGEELIARLANNMPAPGAMLDLGAGTGHGTALLAERFPAADLFAVDIALGMLQAFKQKPGLVDKALRICGDGEALPLRSRSIDLVFSNLAMQWLPDLPTMLTEFSRVSRPGGLLLFSTFGESTLCELRAAWAKADSHTHVNAFASTQTIAEALRNAGFADIAMETEYHNIAYPSVDAILRELKNLGAHNVNHNRPRHLTGKGVFRNMVEAYSTAMNGKGIKASFEIIYGQARLNNSPNVGGD